MNKPDVLIYQLKESDRSNGRDLATIAAVVSAILYSGSMISLFWEWEEVTKKVPKTPQEKDKRQISDYIGNKYTLMGATMFGVFAITLGLFYSKSKQILELAETTNGRLIVKTKSFWTGKPKSALFSRGSARFTTSYSSFQGTFIPLFNLWFN
jgi:hypothetical protein